MTKNEIINLCNILYSAIEGKPIDYQGATKEKATRDLNNGIILIADKLTEARKEIAALDCHLDTEQRLRRHAERTNETTDPESGMPNDDLDSLDEVCKRLRIIRQSEIWDYVCVNQIDDNHYSLWVDKQEYKNNRAAYLFLGKLRDIGNSRAKKAWFEMDSLHIQF